jgi:multidrug resistance efflux pump
MENEDELDLKSESIQDIIGTNPSFVVRWGITFMFFICATLLSLCWLIQYPDTIISQITIKTNVTPKPVAAKVDGRIIKLMTSDGDVVKRGQHLAYMESQADVKDVLKLEKELNRIDSLLRLNDWETLKQIDFIKFNRFGEIQNAFETFFISFQTLNAYWNGSISTGKKEYIQKELNNLKSLNNNLNEQESEILKDLKLAETDFKKNLNLYYDSIISAAELRTIESKYIAKKIMYKQIQTTILNNSSSQYSSSKQLIDIADNIEQEKINFIKVFNILKNEIANWKHDYILSAPDAGKVSFASSVVEFEPAAKGQALFYVMPDNVTYLGEIYLDQYNLGKVESGQSVIIKLKSYPFEEYGVVSGVVDNISEIDVNKQYLVRVKLKKGITTNLNKKLKFRFGMLGDAEIITKNTKIIDKIIYKLKKTGG